MVNLLYNGFSPLSCAASGAVIGLRYLVAARLAWTHLATDLTVPQFLLVGPKDLFLTFVWFAAFLGNEVVWSGHRFQVQQTGEMVDLSPSEQPTTDTESGPRRLQSDTSAGRADPQADQKRAPTRRSQRGPATTSGRTHDPPVTIQ